MIDQNRREFIKKGMTTTAGLGMFSVIPSLSTFGATNADMFFKISLAEWSLHRTLQAGELDNLDFPATAKNDFGIEAVEYVNQFFRDKAEDAQYLNELKQRCSDLGVTSVLIMIDGEGQLGHLDDNKRKEAVEKHYKWVGAAKELGCHSIRVNVAGAGSYEEVQKAAIDGLGMLSEFGRKAGIGVIVENHGGFSSNGDWLSEVMRQVNNPYCGTLPDLGNFCIKARFENRQRICEEQFDPYKGTELLIPYAKGISAKTHVFDAEGNETEIDYLRIMKVVKDAGFTGYVGIEYEGSELSEPDGIKATKKLLEKVGKELS
jgi:sugar phosphate isomerase/epimerase